MGRTAFPLRVQTGCEEHCAFCVIPSTRGPSRSRPITEVLADVDRLAGAGYMELWLVGVHLGSYGRDHLPPASLLELLRALDGARGDVSFRISSLEPMDCSPEIVDLVAQSGRFAPHFHLPLQHGSDRMLAAMRRPYSVGFYRRSRGRHPCASPARVNRHRRDRGIPGRVGGGCGGERRHRGRAARSATCTSSRTPTGPAPRPRP